MKKVININFHGRVVPIEETAYDILKQYVESLRRFFANEEGRDEIINDIEDRIAELFTETIKKGSTCITDEDVNTIIASMGRPEEFEAEESSVKSQLSGEQASANAGYQAAADAPRGRLYRDEADKMLGGVCGGLANYLRIDSSLVRILFAIITFGGFGSGILIYILMWIILPSRSLERNVIRKRLFRNPEDKVIGGVASGLSAYFNMPVWLPRLIFAFPLVIGIFTSILRNAFWDFDPFPSVVFGSFGGTLFIVYVVLWAVIPEAKSASEKLEMKGEKVDLNTIKNTIQEDLKGFGARAEKWGKDVGEKAGQWGKEFGETVGQQGARVGAEFGTATRKSGNRILQVLGVLIKAFFLVIAGVISFAVLMAIIVGSIKGYDFIPLKDYILEGETQQFLVWPTIILFIFLPVVALITWVIRRLMKVPSGKHKLGWIFGGLWTIGLICLIFLIAGIAGNFSKVVSEKFPATIAQPTTQTLTVKLGSEPGRYYPYTVFDEDRHGDDEIFMLTKNEDSMLIKRVTVEVAKSDDSLFHAYIIKFSRGKSLTDAEDNMQKISFNINHLDSVLALQKGFAVTKQTKFRDQRVALVIEIPVGKKIVLDESLGWYDRFSLDWDIARYSGTSTYDKRTHRLYLGKEYIMTSSGIERANKDEERRENGEGVDVPEQRSKEELQREIEEQQRELDRKKKELQKADSTYKYKPSASAVEVKTTVIAEKVIAQPSQQKNTKQANHMLIGDIMMMRFGS
jgi:phage shock protein PspC (stress-responsive transcriptional regulator)